MNKITVVEENILTELDHTCTYQDQKLQILRDSHIELSFTNSKMPLSVEITPNVTVSMMIYGETSNNQIRYTLLENSKMDIVQLTVDCTDQVNVDLNGEHATIDYRYSTINLDKNTFVIQINHNASHTESNVTSHGVNLKENPLLFQVDGVIPKQSKKCICNQDSKIMELNQSTSCIKPNLLIDNYDVEANHAAYIGSFHEEELFYLMSRGISKEKCYELLLEGFLLGNVKIAQEQKNWFLKCLNVRR